MMPLNTTSLQNHIVMKGTEKFRDPFLMAAGLLFVFLLIFFIHYVYFWVYSESMDMLLMWMYMMAANLVFAIFSTINLLYAEDTARYYYKTLMAFAVLVIVGVLLATLISGQGIMELSIYRKVLIFVIIAFLAFLSIASLIKRLEEWSKSNDQNFLNKKKDEFK